MLIWEKLPSEYSLNRPQQTYNQTSMTVYFTRKKKILNCHLLYQIYRNSFYKKNISALKYLNFTLKKSKGDNQQKDDITEYYFM